MKKMMCITLIITAFMLLAPLGVLGQVEQTEPQAIETVSPIIENIKENDSFYILDTESKEILQMSAKDYIFGVVAAEMPALYDIEALKAQAVAAYTYACYKREINKNENYDITTDFTTDQSFKNREQAKKDWGEKAEEYTEKIDSAVNSVIGECLVYDNQPISAVYHAVSCGETYSAEDVWGEKIEYLQSVASQGDKLASNYISVIKFEISELEEKLKAYIKDIKSPFLGKINTKNNGLVLSVEICGEEIAGNQIRAALDLPSTNFKFEQKDEKYVFTCIGYGHGVGMSQNGADYMAKQGYSYKQILSHYYKGAEIERLFTIS